MAKNRFYMYTEYIHFLEGMMPEDQALLFRVILQHEGGLEVEEMTPAVKAVFSMIKNRLDNNREEYEKQCEINRENGKKGGRPKQNRNKPDETEINRNKAKQTEQNRNKPDNDNEKDNEKDKGKDISPLNPPDVEKTQRHRYGEYNNVLLSDEERDKLINEFPFDWKTRVENLSAYMKSTGRSYKDHLATIRNWARREKPNARSGTTRVDGLEEFLNGGVT